MLESGTLPSGECDATARFPLHVLAATTNNPTAQAGRPLKRETTTTRTRPRRTRVAVGRNQTERQSNQEPASHWNAQRLARRRGLGTPAGSRRASLLDFLRRTSRTFHRRLSRLLLFPPERRGRRRRARASQVAGSAREGRRAPPGKCARVSQKKTMTHEHIFRAARRLASVFTGWQQRRASRRFGLQLWRACGCPVGLRPSGPVERRVEAVLAFVELVVSACGYGPGLQAEGRAWLRSARQQARQWQRAQRRR